MTTKRKRHLKSEFALIQTSSIDLIQFHLICKILAKLSGVESERTVSEFRFKKKKILMLCSPTPLKCLREIRKFQVADDG